MLHHVEGLRPPTNLPGFRTQAFFFFLAPSASFPACAHHPAGRVLEIAAGPAGHSTLAHDKHSCAKGQDRFGRSLHRPAQGPLQYLQNLLDLAQGQELSTLCMVLPDRR